MQKSLPERPNLEQLKKQAKELLAHLKLGDSTALQRVRDHDPSSASLADVRGRADWSLNTAQMIIAREYGFASWAKLKAHVTAAVENSDPIEALHAAFVADNAALVEELFDRHPEFKAKINDPVGPFDSPAVTHVRSRKMLDVLLAAGADINAKSRWWAGGFGLLHSAKPELATYAIERGATVDVHAAARLGLMEQLRRLVTRNPSLVHARGGDGQTPLHFARTVQVADFLLDHGADIEARDVDHESTPAQYMIRDRQEIVRYLIHRGCKTDILMAAALGDRALAALHLQTNPDCIRMRVSDECFPMVNVKSGGSIYQWTLGWYVSAPQVAADFGHHVLAEWLMEQSPPEVQLINACWMGQTTTFETLLQHDSALHKRLQAEDRRQLAHAARNNNLTAVRLFLEAGLPVDAQGQHGATPLHWAAWHGNGEMVKSLLRKHPPLESKDSDFQGTPLRWAIHGSENGWDREKGDYAATVQALLDAGALPPDKLSGTEPVQSVLRARGVSGN
jgi:ankyrin repeat protein